MPITRQDLIRRHVDSAIIEAPDPAWYIGTGLLYAYSPFNGCTPLVFCHTPYLPEALQDRR